MLFFLLTSDDIRKPGYEFEGYIDNFPPGSKSDDFVEKVFRDRKRIRVNL